MYRAASWSYMALTFLLISLSSISHAFSNAPTIQTPICPSSLYYDPLSLQCVSCPPGEIRGPNGKCICGLGSFRRSDSNCTSCPSAQYGSLDESFCLGCDVPSQNAELAVTGNQCTCPLYHYIADQDSTGRLARSLCVRCPQNSYPTTSLSGCVKCPDPAMISVMSGGTYSCSCNTTLGYIATPVDDTCLTANETAQVISIIGGTNPFRLNYRDVVGSNNANTPVTITSDLFSNTFMKSAVRCMVQDDVTSCEQLANLCVLAFYDLTTAACQIYQSILRTKAPTVGSADIPYGYPWLVYGWLSGQDTMAFTNSILNMDIDISAGSNSSSIPLFVNIFGQNGSFIGQQQVLEQFQTCTTAENSADWRSIGHNYIARCNVNIADLSRSSEPVLFYDLYVRDRTGALVPAPIRITNYRTTSNRQSNVNANPVDYSSSVLFRRFFGFDSRSGVENGVLKVFRVPTGFEFWIRKVPDTGRIYIPVLDVTYAERDVSILSTGDASLVSSPEFIYTATYIMDLSSFWRIATIIFALVCVAAGLMAFYAARGWSMRNLTSYERWDVNFLSRCVLILAGCLAPFLFLLLLVASAYILFTYKTQSTLGSFLPWTDADVSRFRAILIITLVCQCANVLMLLYQQCEVDIFFIDWERSRGRILRTGGEGKPKLATVSVWRSIFAMNEWDKMQTYRRVNIEFSILAMYFVFQGLRLRNLATAQPNLSDLSPGLISPILLFGAQCIVWIALALAQVLFHVMFFDRFYKNRLLDFVDVLSMANLSILAFDELCHGYYIHGRTVHPCADTNIAELNAFLRREQADLVPRRGLQDTDQQCFEVFAQKDMRSAFNKVYNIVIAEQEDPGRDVATRLQRMSADKRSRPFFGAEESRVRAYETVNHFVRNFFDKNMKDFNYFIRERTGLERFLGVTPNVSTSTVMFHTPSSYGRLLLYGIEHHLLILYVVIFSLADYGLDSTGAAAVITYAVDVILRIARRHFGGNNLARKTMLDKKFLI